MTKAKSTVKVGLVQTRVEKTKSETIARTLVEVEKAHARGAELVVLQELFASPYFCQSENPDAFELAEPMDGPTVRAVSAKAKALGITILVPFFEKRAPGLFHNSSVLVGPDGNVLSLYRKMHIPDDPQFMEKYYFAPGDLGFVATETPAGNVGQLICWDQWYPEAARLTAMLGAQILVYPTAIGWLPSEKAEQGEAQLAAWQMMQRSHAIANGVFVVAVNRVGLEGDPESGIQFWGHSFVADPFGRILAEAGEEEETLVVELDLSLIGETRKWWPFFRDRRIDAFDGLTKRWGK